MPLAIQGSEPARETLGRLGRPRKLETLVGALDGSDGLERVVAKMLKHQVRAPFVEVPRDHHHPSGLAQTELDDGDHP